MVKIRSYVAVDDVGKVVNPMIVDGQVHGGVAQGIAQALFEEAVYDADGNLVTGTMVDYLVPTALDLPSFVTDRTETPATTNPLGVKGVGEAGTIASTPAVVNAVVDALRQFGVSDVQMPCTPERVWRGDPAGEAVRRGRRPGGHDRLRRPADRHDGGRFGMIPAAFEYVRAESVDHAASALAEHGDEAKVLAGGQSLLPLMRLRLADPEVVVDVGRLADLRGVREDGDALVIGALTTHHEVMNNELVRQHARLLADATTTVADPAVRHRGTFGGVARPRGPRRRPAGDGAGSGRARCRPGAGRPADDAGTGLLRRLSPDRAVPG